MLTSLGLPGLLRSRESHGAHPPSSAISRPGLKTRSNQFFLERRCFLRGETELFAAPAGISSCADRILPAAARPFSEREGTSASPWATRRLWSTRNIA